ncbi:MAG: AAA family ATPase [Candidatus Thiodiazotropha sp.]
MKMADISVQELAALPCLYEGNHFCLHLETKSVFDRPVVIKSLLRDTDKKFAARLGNEYQQTVNLPLQGIRQPRSQIMIGGRPALVLDYIEGETLQQTHVKRRQTLAENLAVSIAITALVDELHRENVMHRNLASSHILVSSSPLTVTLIGFGDATSIKESDGLVESDLSCKVLPYISPEQTGRINHRVDHRTDLYSLGVMLYEVFSGKLPFEAEESAEWVYAHLARNPRAPHELNPEIPNALSDLILRLVAKNPDERYQSAFGVHADLKAIQQQLQTTGNIDEISLGQSDYSSRFHLPERLYNRRADLESLQQAIEGAINGRGCVALISGHAGSGKTALVKALRQFAVDRSVYFIVGTYESSQRHVPYVGLRQAFAEWIDLMLTGSIQQLAQWKRDLLTACGGDASQLVDMLPQLKLIIGTPSPAPELGLTQAQHRLHHLFRSFVLASSEQEHPLVLFLDNLQWADHATVQLLNLLLSGIDTLPIVIIAAYRDDEVVAGHPLASLLDSLVTEKRRIRTLHLEPFKVATVNSLIVDALRTDPSTSSPLAQQVLEKTGGNPLFIRQFMQSLYDKNLLHFDTEERRWRWDLDAIRQQPVISSIVDVMANKLDDLPQETRSSLALAACIGTHFRARTLASLANMPESEMVLRLQPAVTAGLLQEIETPPEPGAGSDIETGGGFEFPHDRICQAAYALQPQKQQRLNHLRIGRLLLSQTPEEHLEDWVFEITDQLNQGFQYINNQKEQQRLVTLNLLAGSKAKRAAAYQSAIRYLSMGIGLLPYERWKNPAEPTLELFIEAIEAEYLCANFERAALLSSEALQHTDDLFMRLRVYELTILFFTAQNKNSSAIESGMAALAELGISLNETVSSEERQQLTDLTGRIEALAHQPTMHDLRHLASLRIMMHLATPVQRSNPELLLALVSKMVVLSATHGNSQMAAFAYGWYGALLCGSSGDIEAGYRFGRLSLEILHQFPAAELQTRVNLLFNAYVRHWKEPVQQSTNHLLETYKRGIETGDLEYTSLSAVHHCGYMLCTGVPLESVQSIELAYLEKIESWRLPFQVYLLRIWLQTTANLRDADGDPKILTGEFFVEANYLHKWLAEKNNLLAFSVFCSRTMLQYHFGDYASAVLSAKQAEEYSNSALGLYYQVIHTVHYALALLALYQNRDSTAHDECIELVTPLVDRLRRWAALSPTNFSHKLALVEAELARFLGNNGGALNSFNQAIALARKNGQQMDEALACEREARFYTSLGRDDIATQALRNAVDRFRSWGAERKANLLEQGFKLRVRQGLVSLDTSAVLKVSQMLSQEVHLEQLLEKLMRIVIENAGAEKGLLIQKTRDGLIIQSHGTDKGVSTMNAVAVEESGEAAVSVVNYVAHTHREVVLSNAYLDPTFNSDEYITEHQTRSLLCLPIIYQGKLSALLYLENNLASDVFTLDRLELLKALASQAAISIENATLYTELENKITALRESEQKFRVIFDQTFQFIGVLDTDGTLLQANRTALKFAGIDEKTVIGKPFWETPWWSHSVELQEQLKSAVKEAAKGKLVRFEADHPSMDGRISYIDFSLKPVTDADGNVVQLIPEGRDITERKRAEEELLRYKEHLEETVQRRTEELRMARDESETANRAKSVFLANMSHELRTPLNAILGFSHMMQRDKNLSKDQHESLSIINNSGEHLLKLINDVLEIAKIEAGKLQLVISTYDLHALIREVTDMMRLRAQQKGLSLGLDQSSEFPRYIKGDEARLRQILVNLVSNAVKFTVEGSVTIRLGVDDENQLLLLEVEDTGPGISEDDQRRLFNPFEQFAEDKMQIGTGLGLTIVQHFVLLMGGRVIVESDFGKGSRFRVELPLMRADEAEIRQLSGKIEGEVSGLAPGQPSYRILVAEDQRDNQLLLAKLMADIGMEVKVANNGQECIETFKKWKPDLIWMDRRMPLMDGIEATRKIRGMPGGKQVKIVAVTASAFKEQEPELHDAGMDDYIRKPFLFSEIYDSLAKQLGIEYVYREVSGKFKGDRKVLTPRIMKKVSPELREQLRSAVESLEQESINAVINQIAIKHTDLGRTLSNLVIDFDYPSILSAIDAATTKEQQDDGI